MAVSDVNMSSEGSSTSRVRQFGLYKTIDSHTAEFLKLSRKRQIRRGCACAAVSTAITVTVVVSALLVFVYGFRTDFKMVRDTPRQLNWFQTVNESNATFDKNTPINYKSNDKLLAIILKALDQKRYLETIVEEHSSQRPAHERTTDYPFQKNVFADKNRRMPSKMYEGYKPTSQELFKARHRDSLAKARKVMDYQRVMTYLNTMTLSKKTGETIHTDVSTTSKPYITGIHSNDVSQDFKYQTAKTNTRTENYSRNTRKESYNRHVYCSCPPRSNLTEILEKLYIGIQELQPKAIRLPNNTKNRDRSKPKNKNTVKVQQSKYYADQSKKNNEHTSGKIPPKPKKSIFTKYVATMKSYDKVIAKQNEITTNRNGYKTITHNNHNTYTGETMPWKLDFRITSYDNTSSIYVNTDTNPSKNSTLGKITESDAIAKYSQADEQYDFDEKIYNTPLEPNQYNINTHENKSKTTQEYDSIASYIDGIIKKFAKTSIFNNTQFSLEHPITVKPLDTNLYSYEIVDPIKIVPTVTVKPVEGKQQQNATQLVKNPNDIAVEHKNNSGSLTKRQDGKLSAKPLTIAAIKVDDKLPLDPMIQSYLLSKKDSGILSVGAGNTLQLIELQTTNSEELPFNVKFHPNEEDEHVSILNDLYAAKITTNTADKKKEVSQIKNSRERSGVSKAGKKEKILSLPQIWEPMYTVTKKPLQSSTEAPRNSVYKKPKIKQMFYMTGGETSVEDFDDNLSALMYYDKSPVNYTALANSYLHKIENDSIELSKSMLPESRPSRLEIRRTHERVDFYASHLYSSVEQT